MHRVAVVAVPTVTAFELSVPDLLFGQTLVDGVPGYEVLVCAAEPGAVPAVGGLDVVVRHGLDAVDGAGTVLVIGGAGLEQPGPAVVAALGRAAGRGARLVALSCAGAFLLAAAGLLDGRPATTAAPMAAELRRRFPAVDVRADALFVDGGGVFTCAGHAAAIDLCLALIRDDHGAAVAAAAARGLATAPVRPGGAVQRLADPLPAERALSLAATREWALDRLHRPLSLADLAGHASTSVRTLTRRFTAETGTSPQRWLLARRLERARELLESTDLPVDVVARRSGLGSADSLRAHFGREVGSTPSAYRSSHRARWTAGAGRGTIKIMQTPSDDPLLDVETPNPARIYDYLLGGANNFAADRNAAEQAMKVGKVGRTVARSNRSYLRRAVRFMCAQGVDQFLDLGSGIPTVGNVHEIAQQANPDARVVYVDNESVAVTYARRLLSDDPNSAMVEADLRHPERVLADPVLHDLIDLNRPVGILLVSVLHFVPDEEDPAGIVAAYRDAATGGGYLALSHYTDEGYSAEKRARAQAGKDVYQRRTRTPVVARDKAELTALLDGTELVPPGIVWLPDWRPDGNGSEPAVPSESEMYAAVGRIR